jgi:hypothetical protein
VRVVFVVLDTRISIGSRLEALGWKNVGNMPPATHLLALTRWEAALAQHVIESIYKEHQTKLNGKHSKREIDDLADIALRKYLASGTQFEIDAVESFWKKQWREVFNLTRLN